MLESPPTVCQPKERERADKLFIVHDVEDWSFVCASVVRVCCFPCCVSFLGNLVLLSYCHDMSFGLLPSAHES